MPEKFFAELFFKKATSPVIRPPRQTSIYRPNFALSSSFSLLITFCRGAASRKRERKKDL